MEKTILYSLLFFCSSILSSTLNAEVAIEVNVTNSPTQQEGIVTSFLVYKGDDEDPHRYTDIFTAGERTILIGDQAMGINIELNTITLPGTPPGVEPISFKSLARSCTIDYPQLYSKYLPVLEINLEYANQTQEWVVYCNSKAVIQTKNL